VGAHRGPNWLLPELRALNIQDGGGVDAGARVLLQSPLRAVEGLELPEGSWEPSAALGEGYPDVPVHAALRELRLLSLLGSGRRTYYVVVVQLSSVQVVCEPP
jgi:hypothetical protein